MWQDYLFAAGGLVFVAGLIPTLLDVRSEVPRWKTSVPTAVMLCTFSFAHFTIDLPIAAYANSLTAAVWFAIAVIRPIREYQEIETAVAQFEVTQDEAELILAHREWIAEQTRRRGEPEPGEAPRQHGVMCGSPDEPCSCPPEPETGCGDCPSQAPAGGG